MSNNDSTVRGLSPGTRRTAWIVSAVFFIEQLDATILAPALPRMAQDLGTDPISMSATITAYLLGLTVLIPMSGRLSERFGDKKLFSVAILAFLLSSVACGFAQDAQLLIVLRFIQGMAGALMAPVGRLIVLRAASRQELVEAMALVIMLAMVAPMVGPFLGGVITTYFGWRWIFWVNVPLCLATLYLVWQFLPSTPGRADIFFDTVGAVLTGLSFAGLIYGLVMLGEGQSDKDRMKAYGMLAAGIVLFVLYVIHARRQASPVLMLSLLRLRSFQNSMLIGSLFRIAVGGVPFLMPLTLQECYGYSPLSSGLMVLVPAMGGFAMKFFSTRLLRRMGYRKSLQLHGMLAGFSLIFAGLLNPHEVFIFYVFVLFGFGWARSLQMNAFGTLAYADMEKSYLPSATSFFLSVQNMTTAIGVAFSAVLLRTIPQALGVNALDSHLWTYIFLGMLSLLSALICFSIPLSAGSNLLAAKK